MLLKYDKKAKETNEAKKAKEARRKKCYQVVGGIFKRKERKNENDVRLFAVLWVM